MKHLVLISFVLALACLTTSAKRKNKYTGVYDGSYPVDSIAGPDVRITLHLKPDSTFFLDIDYHVRDSSKWYPKPNYFRPHSEGKWFIREGVLFMAMKRSDTFCADATCSRRIAVPTYSGCIIHNGSY